MKIARGVLMIGAALLMSACSDAWLGDEEDPPLPGTRIDVLPGAHAGLPATDENLKAKIRLGSVDNRAVWEQTGGLATHAVGALAFTDDLPKKIWSVDIGQGSTRGAPLTAQPVVGDGVVYTLDTDGHVSAFDTETGKRIWTRDLEEKSDKRIIGGGLALSGAVMVVTHGTAGMTALDAKTGADVWSASLPTPVRTPPSVDGPRVFVQTIDHRVFALDVTDGHVVWTYRGLGEGASLAGAPALAVTQDIVIVPFLSGELTALRVQNGSGAWSETLSPVTGGGQGSIADIHALPVVESGVVYAASYAGRFVALDVRTGARGWTQNVGGSQTPVVTGNMIYMLSNDNHLVALLRDTGRVVWAHPLPQFKDVQNRVGDIVWTGPVLAGGRLLVVDGDGSVRAIDPMTGDEKTSWKLGRAPAVPMMIVNETLLVLTRDGTLSAYR